VNELVEAADDKQLTKTINRYGRVDLLLIDELGYTELDRRGAELLFQVLTEREEKNSVAIASNDSFRCLDQDLHRPQALRRHRRPPHLRWEHHRNRHRLLPPRPHQATPRRSILSPSRVTLKFVNIPSPTTRIDAQIRERVTLKVADTARRSGLYARATVEMTVPQCVSPTTQVLNVTLTN